MSRDMCLLHSVIVGEKSYDRCCIIHMETDTSTAWQHATQHGMLGDGGKEKKKLPSSAQWSQAKRPATPGWKIIFSSGPPGSRYVRVATPEASPK